MADSASKERFCVRLKGVLEHTTSWARVLEDGRIELEFYDFSPEAQENMGNDVAWIYRIETSQKTRVFELLEADTGGPVKDDRALLEALDARFGDAWQIRDWLKKKGVPYQEEFDSWA